ncbi:MAG TPA: 5'/3'-nucleotidase SurE [Saprospiraceae bacterium]|nr:5'/3'-nucleotidase SurE [Saprospiraceae bacterium]MCB9329302.1 5'/3'-nucleotidase SurE [Lewinellaceae bacterium]HPK09864.1 5'/3'-nucleotidase SurE [Saprospiraceae bacterium]HRX29710.1 5'/3'-nucleotidase SurE [Saprospiraceae bacterium]
MEKPLILVTNDDGIVAPGIRALVDVASKIGEVVVVAPDSPQSGQGHAITINHPIRLRKVNIFDGVEAYECSGTPVDCVKLAKNVLLKDRNIDLCVSGINHGSNASINIIYSGTMSAAMEASLEDVDSIGFSLLDYSFDADFSVASHYAERIIREVLENGIKECNLLNVNFPKLDKNSIKGIKVVSQGEGRWVEEFQEGIDPRGQKYYWLSGYFENINPEEDSDINALNDGYISVVPSGHNLTQYKAIPKLKYLEKIN